MKKKLSKRKLEKGFHFIPDFSDILAVILSEYTLSEIKNIYNQCTCGNYILLKTL